MSAGRRGDLAALCRAAESEAGRWGDPRRAPRRAAAPGRPRWRGPALAAAGLATAAWVAAALLDAPEAAPATGAATAAASPWTHPGLGATTAEPAPLPTAAPAVAVAAVRWDGPELVVALDAVPLASAVEALAAATGTVVAGLEHVRPADRASLHARGADVRALWQRLLADRVAFTASCGDGGCRLWISSGTARNVAEPLAARGAETSAEPGAAPTAPRDERTPDEIASQPDGSC